MKEELINFIRNAKFPCVMAKALITKGLMKIHHFQNVDCAIETMYEFIDEFRSSPGRLSSFIMVFDEELSFDEFERKFWSILGEMNVKDKRTYAHDSRVSSDPTSPQFSFRMKSEAFFILALHPDSPRMARRFKKAAIVFNPHQQFETLRAKNLFTKIRNLIRKRDEMLQGFINPMLNDFGERSEIYQYTGKVYSQYEQLSI